MPKLIIDQEKCISCGSCAAVCPACFEMGDDNKSHYKGEKAIEGVLEISEVKDESQNSCIKEAVDICPTQAIKYDM